MEMREAPAMKKMQRPQGMEDTLTVMADIDVACGGVWLVFWRVVKGERYS